MKIYMRLLPDQRDHAPRSVRLENVPARGDIVSIDHVTWYVDMVMWYPYGDETDREPYAYLILKTERQLEREGLSSVRLRGER